MRLRFIRGGGWDSKVIEYTTRSWCSHAEYITDAGNETFGAQLKGGLTWRSVTDPVYKKVARSETWQITTTDVQDSIAQDFIRQSNHDPYDWRAIIGMSFGERDWREPGSWFCSEWCMVLLEKIGVAKISANEPVDRVTPIMLYNIFVNLPSAEIIIDPSASIAV